jgi:hypothetical protein
VNSKPFLNYSRIAPGNTGYGFSTREEAEIVAGMIVKMIQNGNMSPKLNKRIIDSLELKMNVK